MEHRKQNRYLLDAQAHFTWRGEADHQDEGAGRTSDVGVGGVFVRTQGSPPLAAFIHVEVLLPKPRDSARQLFLRGDGRVIRVEPSAPSNPRGGFAAAFSTFMVQDEEGALMEDGFLTLEKHGNKEKVNAA